MACIKAVLEEMNLDFILGALFGFGTFLATYVFASWTLNGRSTDLISYGRWITHIWEKMNGK